MSKSNLSRNVWTSPMWCPACGRTHPPLASGPSADPSGDNENHAHGEAGRASQSDPSENHIGLNSSRLNPAGRSDHLTKPVVVDLFCKAGGCTKGYQRAGFYVIGIDIEPQPNYCGDVFVQMDALAALQVLLDGGEVAGYRLEDIAGFHASPPCQADSQTQRIQGNDHPRLIEAVRDLLETIGLPYVIENVPGAPLRDPVELCGAMFPPLKVYRHRLFETNFPLPQPPHVPHVHPQVKMGRAATNGEWLQIVGNFSGVEEARTAMGMPWATRDELREAIPPAYTEWIGRFLMAEVREPQGRLAA